VRRGGKGCDFHFSTFGEKKKIGERCGVDARLAIVFAGERSQKKDNGSGEEGKRREGGRARLSIPVLR